MEHNCNNDKLLNVILDDLKDVKSDVRTLLKFKWQMVGGAVVASFIASATITLITKYVGSTL